MSWKELTCVVRRLKFVKLVLKAQQSMSQVCRRFGMSRKSGYKWIGRFEREGPRGLCNRSCRPKHSPRQISAIWRRRIGALRRRHRSWGSRKLAARLRKDYPRQKVPGARTIGKWLKRMKLSRGPRRRSAQGAQVRAAALTVARRSNQVWTVDFKGWFRTGDGQRVEPLTVRDLFSRNVLSVRLLPDQSWQRTRRVFLGLFAKYGYPTVIRTDNGSPFGSKGPAGLTKLSAWWTALGIGVEFIAPGRPGQNGGHEQMHRVLKAETTCRPSRHRRAQQRRMDRWLKIYNWIRPHESLGQRVPGEVYRSKAQGSRRVRLSYRQGWEVRRVRRNGEIKWKGRMRFVGEAFVGYPIGLKGKGRGKQEVYFGRILIGELRDSDPGGIRPARYVRSS